MSMSFLLLLLGDDAERANHKIQLFGRPVLSLTFFLLHRIIVQFSEKQEIVCQHFGRMQPKTEGTTQQFLRLM